MSDQVLQVIVSLITVLGAALAALGSVAIMLVKTKGRSSNSNNSVGAMSTNSLDASIRDLSQNINGLALAIATQNGDLNLVKQKVDGLVDHTGSRDKEIARVIAVIEGCKIRSGQ